MKDTTMQKNLLILMCVSATLSSHAVKQQQVVGQTVYDQYGRTYSKFSEVTKIKKWITVKNCQHHHDDCQHFTAETRTLVAITCIKDPAYLHSKSKEGKRWCYVEKKIKSPNNKGFILERIPLSPEEFQHLQVKDDAPAHKKDTNVLNLVFQLASK